MPDTIHALPRATDPAAQPRTPPFGALTWLLTALTMLGQLSMSMYAPSMPAIAGGLGTTDGMVQLTLSVFLGAFALGQLIVGPLSDRFGRRPVLLCGLCVFAVGSVICASAQAIEVLLAGRLLQALGACTGVAVGRAVVRDLFERDQATRVMAVMGMAFALAPAAGPVIGGYVQAAFDWHAVFAVLSALGALLLVLTLIRLPESNRTLSQDAIRPTVMVRSYGTLLRHPVFLANLIPGASFLGGLFALQASLPFLLIDRLGVDPADYGWLALLPVGGFFLGSVISARFGAGMGPRRAITLALLIQASAGILFMISATLLPLSILGVLGPMALWTLPMGIALPASMAGAMAPFPRMAGSAAALIGCVQMAVGAMGTLLVAKVQDGTLLPPAFMLLGIAILSNLAYRRFGRADGSAQARSNPGGA